MGSDELIRRMRFQYPLFPEAGRSENSQLVPQMDLFDFGEPVDIDLPPADQVTDVDDLG